MAVDGKRIRLGELLLRAGVITEAQLRTALSEQKKWGGKLGTLLVELGFLSEDLLVKALSKQLALPRVDFQGLVIPPEALAKVDAEFANQHQVLPIALDVGKNQLVVAMADPDRLSVVDDISFRTGSRVRVAIAGEKSLASAIRRLYFGEDLSEKPGPEAEEGPMKLLSPLGNTMVRRLDAIRQSTASANPGESREVSSRPPAGGPEDRFLKLEALQRKQLQVIKVVVEMLIAKGVFSREEYRAMIESQGGP